MGVVVIGVVFGAPDLAGVKRPGWECQPVQKFSQKHTIDFFMFHLK